jgi:shikimate dehydrogenase
VQTARLFGVLGDPVDHSLSPVMHNAAFAARGLPHVYLRYRVPPMELRRALREARQLDMGGLNLTVPLKETALDLVDHLTPEAERIGAVNTVIFGRTGLTGHNTDGGGFLRSLGRRARLAGGHAIIVGAGGSARAVAAALVAGGALRITIANRTVARATALAQRVETFGNVTVDVAPLVGLTTTGILERAVAVINTTSVSLGARPFRTRPALTPADCLFVDLVYGSRNASFLAAARRAGRPTLDGAGMLLHQGALAFEAWTKRPAPLGVMARALRAQGLTIT